MRIAIFTWLINIERMDEIFANLFHYHISSFDLYWGFDQVLNYGVTFHFDQYFKIFCFNSQNKQICFTEFKYG